MSLNRCPGITFIIEKDAHHWIMTFDKKSKGRYNFRDLQFTQRGWSALRMSLEVLDIFYFNSHDS